MCRALLNILALAATVRVAAPFFCTLAIYTFPPYFFLFAMVFFGPLRVRAFCLVF